MTENEWKQELKYKLIKYRTSLNLSKEVTFGVEIEYENIAKDTVSYYLEEEILSNNLLKGWINKSEIDISEYNNLGEEMNGEINSPILIDCKTSWKDLKNVLDILIRNKGVISEKCGGHVNIGANILENNTIYWRNFFLLWILYEKEIYKFCSGEYKFIRFNIDSLIENISYSIKLEDILNVGREPYLYMIGSCLFDKIHDIYIEKKSSGDINQLNRIEFRLPNGTLSKEIWQNYINFFVNFLISCKKELDVEKIIYKIKNNQHNEVELADYIFDNKIDKQNFLIQSLKTNKLYKKELFPKKYYY